MKIHEYQSQKLLADFNIPVPRGEVIFNAADARGVFERVANPGAVVKVQVLMGGRGKAGGIQRVKTAEEAESIAASFLGKPFSTYQSGGESKIVKAVLLTEAVTIREEYYLGVVIDRSVGQSVILFSKEGGVDIEEIARTKPAAIQKIYFSADQAPDFSGTGIPQKISDIARRLAKLFIEKDASICEINPLVLTASGDVLALDAKIVFDDNALFRHEELQKIKDPDEDDERERRAKSFGLSYVSMNGNVGCLVNGAGLAMATMDMIKLAGGEPANFLDVGGGATADQVREGFKIILEDQRVASILVNIFGGIMKCDVIAQGVIQAVSEMKLRVPLIVRLEGTRVEEGRELLKKSGLTIASCATIEEAAATAVAKAQEYRKSHVHSC